MKRARRNFGGPLETIGLLLLLLCAGTACERPYKVVAPKQEASFTNSIGMTFVHIPPGTFVMGSPEKEKGRRDDEQEHFVTLTRGFYCQVTEVTQGQWLEVMGKNPSHFQDCGDDCPVEFVSWKDCKQFIRQLNRREGISTYRLPTEAEWEFACRAGSQTAFATGTILETGCGLVPYLDALGWYCGNSGKRPHPAARKGPNAFGLYDMHGNMWEWCEDWYGAYPLDHVTDPTGPPSGAARVLRGGGWHEDAEDCRSAIRVARSPESKAGTLGFRVVRTP
ncbi:MAG: formylglycine-generating enzyme family protein [Thermodesulfobacteriota bacterium]|nr:formylglycine-generating enzyme family protein [Thermodesulfobacteriota bacterium]